MSSFTKDGEATMVACMSTGQTIAYSVALVIGAGLTAGLWLNLVMWIPMLLLGLMSDEESAFAIVSTLSMLVAAAVVLLFGLLVIGLPWYAAAVAGLVVGMTSYARPNPATAY
jgi:hypothetical protein